MSESTDYPAGWYDDPKDEANQERYWDGTGWTHDTRKKFPPGWYDDPDRFGAERYWDGVAFTDDRRFLTRLDEPFPVFRKKENRLLVTGELISWRGESMRWDDVTGFDTLTRLMNGSPALYQVTLRSNGGKLLVELGTSRGDTRTPDVFATLTDQAYRIVTPRILNALYRRADAGEVVEYEKISLSQRGFAKGDKDPVPWTEYAGWRTQNAYLEILRMKGDKKKAAVRAYTTILGRWVLPALIEDFAKRYANPGSPT